ncbi:nucleotidyltransferase substrate binding protein [bacterium]|nr:nucleotidyltransferase substrate binding protein [bacterium]
MQGYIKDACVKRFEYTIETSWKIMKKYLKQIYGKTDKELTMNNIFRLMEGYGFIKSWEDWHNYYEKRNDTSHEYNEERANKILDIIDDFVSNAEFLYQHLSKEIGE